MNQIRTWKTVHTQFAAWIPNLNTRKNRTEVGNKSLPSDFCNIWTHLISSYCCNIERLPISHSSAVQKYKNIFLTVLLFQEHDIHLTHFLFQSFKHIVFVSRNITVQLLIQKSLIISIFSVPNEDYQSKPQVRTIPIQIEGKYLNSSKKWSQILSFQCNAKYGFFSIFTGSNGPKNYVPPSQQVPAEEPKKYTGSSIPSRSFRMLQAMTAPDSCG